ncbi:MAG: type II secretion system protein [Patescibacteria group bacterium]
MKKLFSKFNIKSAPTKNSGFTLIEILVVIGIIAVLATIVMIAINPARQFAQARNTQRTSHVETLLNAIGQHIADNKGVFLGGTPACPALTASTTREHIDSGSTGTGIDLSCLTPTYIPALPTDPDTTYSVAPYTGYDISVDANGRITVYASKGVEPAIAGSAEISITR